MPLVMKTYANLIANLDPLGTGKPKTYIPEVQEALKDDFFNLRFYSGNDEIQNRLRGDKFDMPIWKDGKWQTMEVDKSTMATFLKIMETSFGVGAFHGAKDMARAEMPHLAEGTEGFTEFVSGKYRDGITASQPSFDGVNKPLYIEAGFAKARGILNKTLSLYAGQVFAAFNQTIKTSMGMLSNPTPKTRFKFAQSLTNTIVVNGLIVGAVSTARQNTLGSDKEKERDKLAGNSLKAMLGSLPVLGPGLEGVYEKATRGQVGYDLGNPVLETVNGVIKTVALAVTGNESKAQKEFIRIAPELLGVPQTPIKIGETVYKKATE